MSDVFKSKRRSFQTMTSPSGANDILTENPYELHPNLTSLEAEVLWEYAKLAHHVKFVGFIPGT